MSKYHYRIDATRYVLAPQYGPDAYRSSTRRIKINFGRGELLKTGREAKELAMIAADSLENDASCVSVFRMSANIGYGVHTKKSDKKFSTDWDHGAE